MPASKPVEDFAFLQHWRARGLSELERRIGDVGSLIEDRLANSAPVRILELGCGFGGALMELRQVYGDRVALYGLNRAPRHGDYSLMARNAVLREICEEGDLSGDPLPSLLCCNASFGLPFAPASFDLIISQCAFHYIEDKIRCLREINRVLRPGGMARVDVRLMTAGELLPPELRGLGYLQDAEGRIDLLQLLSGVENLSWDEAELGPYLVISRGKDFLEDLSLVRWVQLRDLDYEWAGVLSVYAAQPAVAAP